MQRIVDRDGSNSGNHHDARSFRTCGFRDVARVQGGAVVSLEILGWCWAAFLAVFAIVMGVLVIADELNYDYEAER